MVSIPSDEMSKFRHRLCALLLRALLFAGIAQLAAPGEASWNVLLGELFHAVAPVAEAAAERSDEQALDPVTQLYAGDACAEVDEVDVRRRLNVGSALPGLVRPQVFWEDSIRIRAEDRRTCRPPNSAS